MSWSLEFRSMGCRREEPAFKNGNAIPPVELIPLTLGSPYKYRLDHDAHRFWYRCCLTHVPAVIIKAPPAPPG
jgi:hypothetical protein